ncbi:hypothetical protein [Holdemania massiliensis]|uniref:hypothetical protein n=1 Tax=Holdemania massiliensis TaxID=1468449 RepID=UPI001F05185D|nr:hypothetical protein [Holdemania massiliensis]MCH1940500.1 hypothetical protein [Holdemania massiliensis]
MRIVASVLLPFEFKRVRDKHKLLHSSGLAILAEEQASRKYRYYYDSKISGLSDDDEIHFHGFVNAPAGVCARKGNLLRIYLSKRFYLPHLVIAIIKKRGE